MNEITQLCKEQRLSTSVLCDAMLIPRTTYYRKQNPVAKTNQNHAQPCNALDSTEKQKVLDLLHSEAHIDKTPYQLFYHLLDQGQYYCSIRTLYRLLAEQGETKDRRAQRCHKNAVKPELIATRQNQVWSWDITKLKSHQRLVYFYLYVILDIYSRYVVGWLIADRECQHLARQLIQTSALRQGIQPGQLTLHADNGPSMTSGTVNQLLGHLGITPSHNRPYTSNDNPFSESQFKTMKYCPAFPERFETIKQAEAFAQDFFDQWYNRVHYHSGIHYLTPEIVHYGKAEGILEQRHQTLMAAYSKHPERFNNRMPTIKKLNPVYINPPQTVAINDLQFEKIMA